MCHSEGSACSSAQEREHGEVAAGGGVAECPVMAGSPVVKADAEAEGLFRDYEGERYWFCCAACGPLFDADPAKYAKAA